MSNSFTALSKLFDLGARIHIDKEGFAINAKVKACSKDSRIFITDKGVFVNLKRGSEVNTIMFSSMVPKKDCPRVLFIESAKGPVSVAVDGLQKVRIRLLDLSDGSRTSTSVSTGYWIPDTMLKAQGSEHPLEFKVVQKEGTLLRTFCKGKDSYGTFLDKEGKVFEQIVMLSSKNCGGIRSVRGDKNLVEKIAHATRLTSVL